MLSKKLITYILGCFKPTKLESDYDDKLSDQKRKGKKSLQENKKEEHWEMCCPQIFHGLFSSCLPRI